MPEFSAMLVSPLLIVYQRAKVAANAGGDDLAGGHTLTLQAKAPSPSIISNPVAGNGTGAGGVTGGSVSRRGGVDAQISGGALAGLYGAA